LNSSRSDSPRDIKFFILLKSPSDPIELETLSILFSISVLEFCLKKDSNEILIKDAILYERKIHFNYRDKERNITKRTVCLNLFLDDLSPLSGSTPLDCSGSGKHSLAGSIIYF
jgi:hypothetical protein